MGALGNFVKNLIKDPVGTIVKAVISFVKDPVGTIKNVIKDVFGNSGGGGGTNTNASNDKKDSDKDKDDDDSSKSGGGDKNKSSDSNVKAVEDPKREELKNTAAQNRPTIPVETSVKEFVDLGTPFAILHAAQNDAVFNRILRLFQTQGGIMKAVFETATSVEAAVEKQLAIPPWSNDPEERARSIALIQKNLPALVSLGTRENINSVYSADTFLMYGGRLGSTSPDENLKRRVDYLFAVAPMQTLPGEKPLVTVMGSVTLQQYIADRLIHSPDLDQTSILRLVDLALFKHDRGANVALMALGMSDLQHTTSSNEGVERWQTLVGLPYYGEGGSLNLNNAGNCAAFISTALYLAGMKPDDLWGTFHDGNNVLQGTNTFRTAMSLSPYLTNSDNNVSATSYFDIKKISSDHIVTFLSGNPPEKAYSQLGPGDLFQIHGSWDHVALVVGFGAADGGQGSSFYPTYEQAKEAAERTAKISGMPETPVTPYIIDQGGSNPEFFPRPISALVDPTGIHDYGLFNLDYGDTGG